MSRNRFEILLRMIHFADNKDTETQSRLRKIEKLVSLLNENGCKTTRQDMC